MSPNRIAFVIAASRRRAVGRRPPVLDERLHGPADEFDARSGRSLAVRPQQLPGAVGDVRLDLATHSVVFQRCQVRFDVVRPVADVVHAGIGRGPYRARDRLQELEPRFTTRIDHPHRDRYLALRCHTYLLDVDNVRPPVAGHLGKPLHSGVEIVDDDTGVVEVFGLHWFSFGDALLISCSSHCTSLKFSCLLAARSCCSAACLTCKAAGSPGVWASTMSVRCNACNARPCSACARARSISAAVPPANSTMSGHTDD